MSGQHVRLSRTRRSLQALSCGEAVLLGWEVRALERGPIEVLVSPECLPVLC
jgi:hypothetical protein